MASETIDARGLSCPQPVILAKKAIEKGGFPLEVIVDSETSKENVSRMAASSGCSVSVEEQGDIFRLRIDKR